MRIVSMKGVAVDMARYIAKNESTVAIGNGGMNARGDRLGRGGKIVKAREEVAREYNQARGPKSVKQVSMNSLKDEVVGGRKPEPQNPTQVEFQNPAQAWAAAEQDMKARRRKIRDE